MNINLASCFSGKLGMNTAGSRCEWGAHPLRPFIAPSLFTQNEMIKVKEQGLGSKVRKTGATQNAFFYVNSLILSGAITVKAHGHTSVALFAKVSN